MNGDDNGYNDGLGGDTVGREIVNIFIEQLEIERADIYRQSNLADDFNVSGPDLGYIKDVVDDVFDILPDGGPDEISENWQTIQDVISYVKSKTGE